MKPRSSSLCSVLVLFALGACSNSESDLSQEQASGEEEDSGAKNDETSAGGGENDVDGAGSSKATTGIGGGGVSAGASSAGGTDPASGGRSDAPLGGNGEGSGAANAGSGGADSRVDESPIVKPPLVTSAEGAYWKMGELNPGDGEATISVNTSTTYQEWHGFGGTFNERGWDALKHLSDTDQGAVIDLLFNPRKGIGFDWGRIPMGPNDYAMERYSLSSGPGEFDITHDLDFLVPYIKAALAVKGDVKFWAVPWSPPPWAKTGETESDGYDKGQFNTTYNEAYAQYFVDWIQAYESQGIPIDYVMPQNEPGFAQSSPTCAFGPTADITISLETNAPLTLGTFVDGSLFPAIDKAGLDTKVWFGSLSNDRFFDDYFSDMMSQPSAGRIAGVGLQCYTSAKIAQVLAEGYAVLRASHDPGNRPWSADLATSAEDANRNNFLPTRAPNNHAYGEETWDLVKHWIDDGVSVYTAWNMVLDSDGFSMDEHLHWPQNALIVVDEEAGSMRPTAAYYVFRHIAQYVAPGATRIGVTGNALAFLNEDSTVTTIIFNEETTPIETTLAVNGESFSFEIPARGWATVNL